MSRRVHRKSTSTKGKEKIISSPSFPENIDTSVLSRTNFGDLSDDFTFDWTRLPDDILIQLLSCLSYRDRASLACTCKTWKYLESSPCLWSYLDFRSFNLDSNTSILLSTRCSELRSIRFSGSESASAIIHLRACNLKEIIGDSCRDITDATLCVIAARHEFLENLQIGPEGCEKITSDAIHHVALCCPKLKKLRLSGVREIDAKAIGALGRCCLGLEEIAFTDCLSLDESEIGNVSSLKLLTVAGTKNIKWASAALAWRSKLPNLVGLDVSRTDVNPNVVSRILSSFENLKVMCALNCVELEVEGKISPGTFSRKGKLLIASFVDVSKGTISSFFPFKDRHLSGIKSWLEWILSECLLRIAENKQNGIGDEFWLNQGMSLLLGLVESCQEDVQERAANGLATFVVMDDDENVDVDHAIAEAVMKNNGVPLLLELARTSRRENIQSEAAKVLGNLSVNSKIAKAIGDEGGIRILVDLARSMNKLVAEEAAGGLWNLSAIEENKVAIAGAGGVKALVELVYKWQPSGAAAEGVLERAAGALANLAGDDECSMEVALVGGVQALVTLIRSCKVDGVQEQAARALSNLTSHGDSCNGNTNSAVVGQEAGAIEALLQLTSSRDDSVRQEAACALWNLSFDDSNREAIAAHGGVEALITLARTCSNASPGLQVRAAGALWGLSVSEANSISIGREGGVAPLITLAHSNNVDVHKTATGALLNLSFNLGTVLRIVEDGGVPALVHVCSSSPSAIARFMAVLTLSYMFDGRMDQVAVVGGTSSEGGSMSDNFGGARRLALKHIEDYVFIFTDQQVFTTSVASALAPASLEAVTEAARIQEAGQIRCSNNEIGRFVTMLRNPSPVLQTFAAFALLQFTIPDGQYAIHHARIIQKAGALRVLRGSAACANAPIAAKIFSRIVLRNLEHHQPEY